MSFFLVCWFQESVSSSSTEDGMEDRVVIKRVRLSNPVTVTSPVTTSPSTFLSSNGYEPLQLPTKKRMTSFTQQYSEMDQFGKYIPYICVQTWFEIWSTIIFDLRAEPYKRMRMNFEEFYCIDVCVGWVMGCRWLRDPIVASVAVAWHFYDECGIIMLIIWLIRIVPKSNRTQIKEHVLCNCLFIQDN